MIKVSIIIPCYNAERWIGEAIESALRQDFSDIEIVVIDDGSTDDSRSVIAGFGARVKLGSQSNQGPSAARNHGLKRASGELIQFLDADDLLHPSRISTLLRAWEDLPDADFAAASYRVFQGDSSGHQQVLNAATGAAAPKVIDDVLAVDYLPWAAVFKRLFLNSIGPWNESLTRWVDLEYHARIAARSYRAFPFVDLPLYGYRQHDGPRISKHNKAHTNLDEALRSLTEAKRQLEPGRSLSQRERAWLFPFYVHLARGYAKTGDCDRFIELLRAAANCTSRSSFKFKSKAAEIAATIFGTRVTSELIERALASSSMR